MDEGDFDENDFDPRNVLVSQLSVRDIDSGRVVTGSLEGHTSVVLTLVGVLISYKCTVTL